MMSIEKVVTPIEGEQVKYVDTTSADTREAMLGDGAVIVRRESIEGALTLRVPLSDLGWVVPLLGAVLADPDVPTDPPLVEE